MANVPVGSLVANNLLAIASHPAGQVSFGPLAVPAGFTMFVVLFDLQQVTSLTAVFNASVEISFDNGATFTSAGVSKLDMSVSGYVLNGGVLTRPQTDFYGPGPVRIFGARIDLKQSDLTTRQVRGVLSCTESVISGVTLVAW